MIDYSNATLEDIIIHWVGNKSKEETLKLSKKNLVLENKLLKDLMLQYFLKPFSKSEFYHLSHPSNLELNEVYHYCSKIFDDPSNLFIQSINIAKHLFEKSVHPQVKGGELYVAYIDNCNVENELVDAIGLFKSESKDTYLKVNEHQEGFEVNKDEGININKLDKGCIIFNCEREKGFKICLVDNTNKNNDAQYWKDQFIQAKTREDSFHHTKNFLDLCTTFVGGKMKDEFDTSKAEEVDLMNRSIKYFKEKSTFDIVEFSNEVLQQSDIIHSFNDYKSTQGKEQQQQYFDEFDISQEATKTKSRVYKSIIKLDKNFHVYIHGNKDMISKGYDEESRLNFYQLFFKEEH